MRILQNGLKLTRSGVKTMLLWVLVCFLFLLVFVFHGLIDDPRAS